MSRRPPIAGISILAGAVLAALATPAAAQRQSASVEVACDFLEIGANKGKGGKPEIDPALAAVEKKLKKAPFSTQWGEFKLLSRTAKTLAKRKTEAIALRQGAATATLVEVVDKSKVRLTVTIDSARGKKAVDNTSTIDAGDYVIYTIMLPNEDGHLVAVTCR